MATLLDIVKKGSTSRSVTLRIIDSTAGTPETEVVFDTAGIDLWYRREGALKTSITEADLATPDLEDVHLDGGFLHIGNGEYRLDVPDAAFATAANHVDIGGTVTGMVVIGGRVRLVDYDMEDTVRLGLTALPNAVADAAGGLPTTTKITDARLGALTDWINGGRLDLLLDAIPTTAMRGTDSAALASVCTEARLQALTDWLNGGRLDLLLDAIPTTAMRGTDSAALASVCTEARLQALTDWLNGGRLDLLLDAIPTTAMRGTDSAALASVCTEARLAALTDWLNGGRLDLLLDAIPTTAMRGTDNAATSANVNTEVSDVLKTDTVTLPGQGAPTATPTMEAILAYLFKSLRNKSTQDSTTFSMYADDGTTVDHKATVSEAGGVVTKGELGTGA